MKPTFWRIRILGVTALLGLVLSAPAAGQAQGSGSRTFAETGMTVSGAFLTYWEQHGGLAQQGYPISPEIQEKSDLNGKPYTVQYFERAIFEKHPENAPPYDVLLAQLGTLRYQARYAQNPPRQTANDQDARLFPQTGHTVGGTFLAYWEQHGGLAQQGYPISDEFQEKSDLNGKTYTVQYFERAVFELHPENQSPYEVLLAQLGTFRYNTLYKPGTARPTAPAAANPCVGVPNGQNSSVIPTCGPAGTLFDIAGTGFKPGESVARYYTSPAGEVVAGSGTGQGPADSTGTVHRTFNTTGMNGPDIGIWAATFEGVESHNKAVAYFKVLPPPATPTPLPGGVCGDIPASKDATVVPQCGTLDTLFAIEIRGFAPNEKISFWITAPDGYVVGTGRPLDVGPHNGTLYDEWSGYDLADLAYDPVGVWAITYQGASSGHQAIAWLKITR